LRKLYDIDLDGGNPIHIPSGHLRVNSSGPPVSSRLLRLARIGGQPILTTDSV
jgi:hypothetical protein